MAKRVQHIRDATAQADTFTGLIGEFTMDTTRNAIRVHDGSTPGGFETARADANNIQVATNAQDGKMTAALVQNLEAAQTNIATLQTNVNGELELLITGTGPVTLTAAQAQNRVIVIKDDSPAPTGNPYNIDIPDTNTLFTISNQSSVPLDIKSVTETVGIVIQPNVTKLIAFKEQTGGTTEFDGHDFTADDNIEHKGSNVPGSPATTAAAIDAAYNDLDTRLLAEIAATDADLATKMDKSANLSDVTSAKTSRDNLSVAIVPVGAVMLWTSNTSPAEWEIMDGTTIGSAASSATLSSDDYQTLFEHLWNNFSDTDAPVSGGRGGTANGDWVANKSIGIPDMRHQAAVGANNASLPNGANGSFTTRALGVQFGTEDVTLTTAQIPVHSHGAGTLAADSDGTHTHDLWQAGGAGSFKVFAASAFSSDAQADANAAAVQNAGAHTHTVSGNTANEGSGNAHPNIQPSRALNYIIFSGVV